MRGARREHPRQWAVTDEQRSRWPGAAPPRRAGAVWLSGVVARSLQTAGGYARRSRLARQPNSHQQNRNLFLSRPLIRVAVRMFLLPTPGRCDDVLEFRVFWYPTELFQRFVGASDQSRRIAMPARFLDCSDRPARDFLAHLNHFADGITRAVSQVVETLSSVRQGEDVRLGEVNDVNVVANASAIRRGVIGAEDVALRRLAEDGLEHVGNQMRLDSVVFAEALARTRRVEVTERDELQTVNSLIPLQHLFEHQLRLAVRIDRARRQFFGHRQPLRSAVHRAGGAEHEFFDAGGDGRVQELQ